MKMPSLSAFTPSLMAPEQLEALLVQREPLARRMVERIRDSALTPAKHHTLLIGPRGIGKTHLVALIYHRIQATSDLHDRLRIAWLREEEWGVTSFLDLLLRIFRALQSEYPQEIPTTQVEALYALPPAEAERQAGILLKEFIVDRALLLLTENLDDLFDGLGDMGQKRLRAYIQENPFCTILATSQSLFNGVSLQTSPFYGFFRIQHLSELNLEEATLLLTNIANLRGDRELADFISTPIGRARIRALQLLTGGSPRVCVLFAQFLTRAALDDLIEPFLRTLDELTPYYQARMAWLSGQQRKIVEFLCDRRRAVTVKEIAQRNFLSPQTTASQLNDLKAKGYVQSTAVGRESYYELREPLMRICIEVKKNRGAPIRLFVDFLRFWYTGPELQQQLEQCKSDATLEQTYLRHALEEGGNTEDPRLAQYGHEYWSRWMERDYAGALQIAEELAVIEDGIWARSALIVCLFGLRRQEEALASLRKASELHSDFFFHFPCVFLSAMFMHEVRSLSPMHRWEECLAALDYWLDCHARISEISPSGRAPASVRLGLDLSGCCLVEPILGALLTMENNVSTLRQHITRLIDICGRYGSILPIWRSWIGGSVLVRTLNSPRMDMERARTWRDLWYELAGDRAELEIPLRLLDAAVRYREKRDPRILLELPMEERKVLEPLLQIEEVEEAKPV